MNEVSFTTSFLFQAEWMNEWLCNHNKSLCFVASVGPSRLMWKCKDLSVPQSDLHPSSCTPVKCYCYWNKKDSQLRMKGHLLSRFVSPLHGSFKMLCSFSKDKFTGEKSICSPCPTVSVCPQNWNPHEYLLVFWKLEFSKLPLTVNWRLHSKHEHSKMGHTL